MTEKTLLDIDYSKYNFRDPEQYLYKSRPGLSAEVVEEISRLKDEPEWLRKFRHKSYEIFLRKPMPLWGGDLSRVDFDNIYYYVRPSDRKARSWDDVPEYIRKTFDRLGIPEAERKFLAGVGAQYESEVVYHNLQKELEKKGVIFVDPDTAFQQYQDIFKPYFGKVVPPEDNKFAALNSAVFSGGSFIYVPEGVEIEYPLQAYFRINAANMGQFERTLIIAEPHSRVHYIEGCLPEYEKVSTGQLMTPISAVRPDDIVVNGNGYETLVRGVRIRDYDGDLVEITPISPHNTFRLTPDHPILCVRRDSVRVRRRQRNNWMPEVDSKKLVAADLSYIPAGEVKVGDFLVFPINKEVEEAKHFDEHLLRLLGYYLAEGSAYIHRKLNIPVVEFALGAHEEKLIEDISKLVERVTGRRPYIVRDRKKNGVMLVSYSPELFETCIRECGRGAATKRLSRAVMRLPPEMQRHLLEAYFRGDGSIYSRGRKLIRASTCSEVLAFQVQELLARQGIYASIMRREGGEDTIAGRKIRRKDQYIIAYSLDKRWSEVRRTPDYFLVPVKGIARTRYKGKVYNIEVADSSQSYLARGFVVHNCTAPIYSTESLHSAVVEIVAKKGAYVRYTTLQNWSTDVYNLVTKRAHAYEEAVVEWVDANVGCLDPDTGVSTEGEVKPIEDVEVGDVVHTLGPDLRIGTSTVLGKKVNPPRPVYRLVTTSKKEVVATSNHPFLALRRGSISWRMLRDVRVGDLIAVADKMPDRWGDSRIRFESVVSIEPAGERVTYDIEVGGTANFIAEGIIVHNSRLTMKYPSVYLLGRGARAEILSVAFAGRGQHQDTGAKAVHLASDTTSRITSKSVCKDGGRTSYRGLLHVAKGAKRVKSSVRCDALILDDLSRTDTYPYNEINEEDTTATHEASVGKIGEDQLFYLMSRGLSEQEALNMVVLGFLEPFTKTLPMEYAVEFNRLIELEMAGSVG